MSLPPCGIASRALTTRFMTIWSTCPGSALIRPSAAPWTVVSSMSSPIMRRSILSIELLALGDIVHRDDRAELPALRVHDRLAADEQGARRAVARKDHDFGVPHVLALQRPQQRDRLLLQGRPAVHLEQAVMLGPL